MFCKVLRINIRIIVEIIITAKIRYNEVNIKPLAISKLAKTKKVPFKIAKLIL